MDVNIYELYNKARDYAEHGKSFDYMLRWYLPYDAEAETEHILEQLQAGIAEGKAKMRGFRGADMKQFKAYELKARKTEGESLLKKYMEDWGEAEARKLSEQIIKKAGVEFNPLLLDYEKNEKEVFEKNEMSAAVALYIEARRNGIGMGEDLPRITGFCVGVQSEACYQIKENLNIHSVKTAAKVINVIIIIMVFLIVEAVLLGVGMGGVALLEMLELFGIVESFLELTLGLVLVGLGFGGAAITEEVAEHGAEAVEKKIYQKCSNKDIQNVLDEILTEDRVELEMDTTVGVYN